MALPLDWTPRRREGRPPKAGALPTQRGGRDSMGMVLEADVVQHESGPNFHSVVIKMKETRRNNEFNQ